MVLSRAELEIVDHLRGANPRSQRGWKRDLDLLVGYICAGWSDKCIAKFELRFIATKVLAVDRQDRAAGDDLRINIFNEWLLERHDEHLALAHWQRGDERQFFFDEYERRAICGGRGGGCLKKDQPKL